MPDRPPLPLTILLDTPDYVAVSKPAGLAAIPGRAEVDSVLERLARQIGLPHAGTADPRVRVVHRIDKDTSGVMLFAKHTAAQRYVSHQFQNNMVAKEYFALVHGKVTEDRGTIETRLAPHPTQKERMTIVRRDGRPAVTDWQIGQRYRGHTLVRVFPKTGKTHQIRVHLAHLGHPLVCDPLYGSEDPLFLSQFKRNYRPTRGEEERPLLSRLGLHAASLTFNDLSGTSVTLSADPPKDFRASINQLGKA